MDISFKKEFEEKIDNIFLTILSKLSLLYNFNKEAVNSRCVLLKQFRDSIKNETNKDNVILQKLYQFNQALTEEIGPDTLLKVLNKQSKILCKVKSIPFEKLDSVDELIKKNTMIFDEMTNEEKDKYYGYVLKKEVLKPLDLWRTEKERRLIKLIDERIGEKVNEKSLKKGKKEEDNKDKVNNVELKQMVKEAVEGTPLDKLKKYTSFDTHNVYEVVNNEKLSGRLTDHDRETITEYTKLKNEAMDIIKQPKNKNDWEIKELVDRFTKIYQRMITLNKKCYDIITDDTKMDVEPVDSRTKAVNAARVYNDFLNGKITDKNQAEIELDIKEILGNDRDAWNYYTVFENKILKQYEKEHEPMDVIENKKNDTAEDKKVNIEEMKKQPDTKTIKKYIGELKGKVNTINWDDFFKRHHSNLISNDQIVNSIRDYLNDTHNIQALKQIINDRDVINTIHYISRKYNPDSVLKDGVEGKKTSNKAINDIIDKLKIFDTPDKPDETLEKKIDEIMVVKKDVKDLIKNIKQSEEDINKIEKDIEEESNKETTTKKAQKAQEKRLKDLEKQKNKIINEKDKLENEKKEKEQRYNDFYNKELTDNEKKIVDNYFNQAAFGDENVIKDKDGKVMMVEEDGKERPLTEEDIDNHDIDIEEDNGKSFSDKLGEWLGLGDWNSKGGIKKRIGACIGCGMKEFESLKTKKDKNKFIRDVIKKFDINELLKLREEEVDGVIKYLVKTMEKKDMTIDVIKNFDRLYRKRLYNKRMKEGVYDNYEGGFAWMPLLSAAPMLIDGITAGIRGIKNILSGSGDSVKVCEEKDDKVCDKKSKRVEGLEGGKIMTLNDLKACADAVKK